MIERLLKVELLRQWDSGKVLIVIGPRQAGKTTLLTDVCNKQGAYLFINGDDPEVKTLFESAGEGKLRQIIGKHTTVFIDEAQRIPDIQTLSIYLYKFMHSLMVYLAKFVYR